MRAHDDSLVSLALNAIAAHAGEILHRRFAHRHFANSRLARTRDCFTPDAVVDHRVVVSDDVIVDDRGVAINVMHCRARHEMTIRRVVAEVSDVHERVMEISQPEFKSHAHVPAEISETRAMNKVRFGRQWRSATEAIRMTPAHPRRSPFDARRPHPATTGVMIPTTVMKRRPAPRVIGVPIPACVGPIPATAIAVRTPFRNRNRDGRLPAPPVAREIDPTAVRRE